MNTEATAHCLFVESDNCEGVGPDTQTMRQDDTTHYSSTGSLDTSLHVHYTQAPSVARLRADTETLLSDPETQQITADTSTRSASGSGSGPGPSEVNTYIIQT